MIRNLVFEGGGVKGVAYGGALTALNEAGVLENVERVAGTSAGAITAVLLAVGYSAKELSDIVAKTDFNDFADDDPGKIRDTARLVSEYGWHKGEYFMQWIGDLIAEKFCDSAFTFQDLKDSGGLDLYLTATNLTKQRVDVFSYEHTPDVEIRKAARMSMSIPIYFKAIQHDGCWMADGGMSFNYPVNLFDDKKYLAQEGYGKTANVALYNQETLGFRLDSKDEISTSKSWGNGDRDIKGLIDFSAACIDFLQYKANRAHLKKEDWHRTIFIDSLDVMATDFSLSREKINALIESGRQGVKNYFKQHGLSYKHREFV